MIDRSVAEALLDFGSRGLDPARATEQLEGAVALHNLLDRHGVAYLADEVGMGKTTVALGVVALFRHFQPDFRVLVVAPRENIQRKWEREAQTFFAQHMRYSDVHCRGVDGEPATPRAICDGLVDLVEEALIDPKRDFFTRLTSFSLGFGDRGDGDLSGARRLRDRLRWVLPWLPDDLLDLRSKSAFKLDLARIACSALPEFDLVIIDESHNLKHGLGAHVSMRNQALAYTLGHPVGRDARFPRYGPRCKRVLLLSATPIETSYEQLANQLAVFDRDRLFPALRDAALAPEQRREIAAQFLIRRVTALQVCDQRLTRNLYRQEWRRGGMVEPGLPITAVDDRQQLVVALMQKKVGELVGDDRFRAGFQIGMLASFESFLETSKVGPDRGDGGEEANFDDAEQTEDALEREGIDTAAVNGIARDYRRRFGKELPHPKMDAVVDALASAWETGEKALVFVRRVASVKELKRKLDERYDEWLLRRLRAELPTSVAVEFERQVAVYGEVRRRSRALESEAAGEDATEDDRGGNNTFFAWFFRGEGPRDVFSGANLQKRFKDDSGVYATFFLRNYASELLGARPGGVLAALVAALESSDAEVKHRLGAHAQRCLRDVRKIQRGQVFEALQAAAVDLLAEHAGPLQARARVVAQNAPLLKPLSQSSPQPVDAWELLEEATFFTEVAQRPTLRQQIWPASKVAGVLEEFRESELRAQLVEALVRLGHGLLDLYVLSVQELGSMKLGARSDEVGGAAARRRIDAYLDILERQVASSGWSGGRELVLAAEHFHQILESNMPEVRSRALTATASDFGRVLGRQQPVGGMFGAVNQTLVKQFRMPGYPLVLISTDLLREGEDLHTFCARIVHYGIEWMPSSMEQRVGRVDRVRSLAHRRMQAGDGAVRSIDKVQVHYPYLADTVEVLQIARVLGRMDEFLVLMHKDLLAQQDGDSRINTNTEMLREVVIPEPPQGVLRTAFPVNVADLAGEVRRPVVGPEMAARARSRLEALPGALVGGGGPPVQWEVSTTAHSLLGSVQVGARQQPFHLYLESFGERLVLRCMSPVGKVKVGDNQAVVRRLAERRRARLGALATKRVGQYDLTVEADVLLGIDAASDAARAAWVIEHIVHEADDFERLLLEETDQPLSAFRPAIEEESRGDR